MPRNWDWSYQCGKERRLEAEQAAFANQQPVPQQPPLHSYDATMQHCFAEGWYSITPVEIQRAIKPPPSNIGQALRENQRLRDILRITSCLKPY